MARKIKKYFEYNPVALTRVGGAEPEPTPEESTTEVKKTSKPATTSPSTENLVDANGILISAQAQEAARKTGTAESATKSTSKKSTKENNATAETGRGRFYGWHQHEIERYNRVIATSTSQRAGTAAAAQVERDVAQRMATEDRNNSRGSMDGIPQSNTSVKTPEELKAEARAARKEETAAKNRRKAGDKVWEKNAHRFAFGATRVPKETRLAAADSHPMRSAGLSAIMGIADKAHKALNSFINDPSGHISAQIAAAHEVADKIEQKDPTHPYAKDLRDWAGTLSAPDAPNIMKTNLWEKPSVSARGAQDVLVDAGVSGKIAARQFGQTRQERLDVAIPRGVDKEGNQIPDYRSLSQPTFSVANPTADTAKQVSRYLGHLITIHNKVQAELPEGMVHPVDRTELEAASRRANELVAESMPKQVSIDDVDIDPLTEEKSMPGHIFLTNDRVAGVAKQMKISHENHEILKRTNPRMADVMGHKIAEALATAGPQRSSRTGTPAITLTPTVRSFSDASNSAAIRMRAVDVRQLPSSQQAFKDSKGQHVHPQKNVPYVAGDIDPNSGQQVKLSRTHYWKPTTIDAPSQAGE